MIRLREYNLKQLEGLREAKRAAAAAAAPEDDLLLDSDGSKDDVLTASLHNLIPEDIELPEGASKKTKKKKKKNSAASALQNFVFFCSLAVFLCCAAYLVWNLADKARGNAMYDDVASQFGDIFLEDPDDGAVSRLPVLRPSSGILCLKDKLYSDGDENTDYEEDSRIDEMRAKLTALSESFPDLYGWIYIEGTQVNYPLVQGEDNNYYLNASPYKEPLVNGSIFVDYRNSGTVLANRNMVMYGHNLTGGGMFHDVQNMAENEELFRKARIYIYTMDGAYIYEPFAVYDTISTDQYFRTYFAKGSELVKFANNAQEKSRYNKGLEFTDTDRILTMSTCTNRTSNGRFALHAKLIQVIN